MINDNPITNTLLYSLYNEMNTNHNCAVTYDSIITAGLSHKKFVNYCTNENWNIINDKGNNLYYITRSKFSS